MLRFLSRAEQNSRSWKLPYLALLAVLLLGMTASAFAAWREYTNTLAVERAELYRRADAQAARLQAHVAQRESLVRTAGAAFAVADPLRSVLNGVNPRLLNYIPEAYSFVWAPRVPPSAAPAVLTALAEAGIPNPVLMGPGRKPLAQSELTDPLIVVFDILPKTEQNLSSVGLNLASVPAAAAALRDATARVDVAATAPLNLLQLPGVPAIVLYMPVTEGTDGDMAILGFIGFSFRLDTLVSPALDGAVPVRISDVSGAAPETVHVTGQWQERAAHVTREARIGGRLWLVDYQVPPGFGESALRRGWQVGFLSLLFVASVTAALGYILSLNGRLRQADARLRIVNSELAHRLKNVFAVAQSLANQSFKDVDAEARKAFSGRMESLAHGASLLSQRGWAGADIKELIRVLGLPYSDRVKLHGPELHLGPATAQNLTLLLHELWTNACKHGALAGENGHVLVAWNADGGRFRFSWTEVGAAAPDLGKAKGFGRTLIERLVPMQLEGSASLTPTESGIVYALEAPATALQN